MEIRVGITVLLSTIILIAAVMWLSTYAKSSMMRVWHVRFPEAGGLGEGDEVMVNGIRKGAVRRMELVGDHVVVDLALANELTLTRHCEIAIRNVGLMGEKVIAVDLATTGSPWSTRDTIPGDFETGMSEVMAEAGRMVSSVRRIVTALDSVASSLSDRGGLAGTIQDFRATSIELRRMVEENRGSLRTTLDNFASSSEAVRGLTVEREVQLKETLDHFASAARKMDSLSSRLDSLRIAAQNVATKLDRGEGSLGRLVNDDRLYADLNSSVRQMKSLIEDMKKNPRKYFKFSVF